MKGFNMGVRTVFSTETALLRLKEDWWAVGLKYMKKTAPYKILTTVRWEVQVENAFCLPLLEGICRMVTMMKM